MDIHMDTKEAYLINALDFKNLKIEVCNSEFRVVLKDTEGYEILRGYGDSIVNAINDLHQNLI